MHTGYPVDDEKEDARHKEGPGGAGGGTSELQAHLPKVSVPPATLIRGSRDTIKGGNKLSSEEAGKDVAHEAANTVEGKDIETIVDREEVLVLDGKEAAESGNGTDESGDVDRDCGSS